MESKVGRVMEVSIDGGIVRAALFFDMLFHMICTKTYRFVELGNGLSK